MLLLFVVEVMNLFWVLVLVLTVVVIAEKILPWGLLMSKALGGVLLATAAYLAPTGSAMGSQAMGCMAGARRVFPAHPLSPKLLWLPWTKVRS